MQNDPKPLINSNIPVLPHYENLIDLVLLRREGRNYNGIFIVSGRPHRLAPSLSPLQPSIRVTRLKFCVSAPFLLDKKVMPLFGQQVVKHCSFWFRPLSNAINYQVSLASTVRTFFLNLK